MRNPNPVPFLLALLLLVPACRAPEPTHLELTWDGIRHRPWAGSDLWANRLQDWEVRDGRLQALQSLPMRTAHLLTRKIQPENGPVSIALRMGVTVASRREGPGDPEGPVGTQETPTPEPEPQGLSRAGAAGILLGAGGSGLDPRRAALIHHSPGPGGGIFLGVDEEGHLLVSDFSVEEGTLARSRSTVPLSDSLELRIHATPQEGRVLVDLEAASFGPGGEMVALVALELTPEQTAGGLALVSHGVEPRRTTAWFSRVRVEGPGAVPRPEAALGPVLGAQHTLSRGTLKLAAQLLPVSGPADGSGPPVGDSVLLETSVDGRRWREAGRTPVVVPGYTATFRITDWSSTEGVSYRLTFLPGPGGGPAGPPYAGLIRPEPVDKAQMVVAAFTGNHNVASPGVDQGSFDWLQHLWFPHDDIVAHVQAHDPDFLFFSGDQVYEGASPTRADYGHPYEDYLYKWYLWLWAFRDLTREIPSVAIPDDHDVFHGNVWGAGGRATPPGLTGADAQDQGGYRLPPAWVNMVERTQASHLPDPWDPTPVEQGIGVYYTDILYGGVSFAVVEDRKFKSPPKLFLPEAQVWNGWAQNPSWNAMTGSDAPGAQLLGQRQEDFLEAWTRDWSQGVWMKVLLSQTLFANVATIPADAMSGSVIPSLPIPEPGAWVEGDKQAADMDSNGWPPSGRDRAVRILRKGFAVHLSGDQHLASTIQYGVDDWRDGSFALCVPSVANFWPRRWYPPEPGGNRDPEGPLYAGDFLDGFGNRMTVYAVSNPARWGRQPEVLHNRAPGYGIARFDRATREVTLEAWPRWADPAAGDPPYPGWPVRFRQEDNYGKEPWGFLPTLEVEGMENPVVQVVLESTGEVVYTLRILGTTFTPGVYQEGSYTVRVGEPGTERMEVLTGLEATPEAGRVLSVGLGEG